MHKTQSTLADYMCCVLWHAIMLETHIRAANRAQANTQQHHFKRNETNEWPPRVCVCVLCMCMADVRTYGRSVSENEAIRAYVRARWRRPRPPVFVCIMHCSQSRSYNGSVYISAVRRCCVCFVSNSNSIKFSYVYILTIIFFIFDVVLCSNYILLFIAIDKCC